MSRELVDPEQLVNGTPPPEDQPIEEIVRQIGSITFDMESDAIRDESQADFEAALRTQREQSEQMSRQFASLTTETTVNFFDDIKPAIRERYSQVKHEDRLDLANSLGTLFDKPEDWLMYRRRVGYIQPDASQDKKLYQILSSLRFSHPNYVEGDGHKAIEATLSYGRTAKYQSVGWNEDYVINTSERRPLAALILGQVPRTVDGKLSFDTIALVDGNSTRISDHRSSVWFVDTAREERYDKTEAAPGKPGRHLVRFTTSERFDLDLHAPDADEVRQSYNIDTKLFAYDPDVSRPFAGEPHPVTDIRPVTKITRDEMLEFGIVNSLVAVLATKSDEITDASVQKIRELLAARA